MLSTCELLIAYWHFQVSFCFYMDKYFFYQRFKFKCNFTRIRSLLFIGRYRIYKQKIISTHVEQNSLRSESRTLKILELRDNDPKKLYNIMSVARKSCNNNNIAMPVLLPYSHEFSCSIGIRVYYKCISL